MKTTLKASNIKKISAQQNTVPISRTLKKKLEQCGQMHPNDLNFLPEKTKKKAQRLWGSFSHMVIEDTFQNKDVL